MNTKVVFILPALMAFSFNVASQQIDTWIRDNQKIPVNKLYLHTDREFYHAGETIWLKSYQTDSHSGRLLQGAENIFVRLSDEQGNTVLETNLLSINGQSPGHLYLPETIKPGNYLLRAGTQYMLNFGEESYFHKNIAIAVPSRTLRGLETRQRNSSTRRMAADVQFLPEGGKLLQGVTNLVAFKATDMNGFGVEVKGSVRDEAGNEVAVIGTDYKGMGIFFLKPEAGKKYRATIQGFPSFRFHFDSLVVAEGIKIQLVNQTTREVTINVTSNTGKYQNKPFFLVSMHRGQVIFYQPFQWLEQNQLLRFSTEMLNGGINQILLLDENLAPVSERLLFCNDFSLKEISAVPDSQAYSLRSEVKLFLKGGPGDKEISNLSVAVVHQSAFSEKGPSNHILSSLLIDSELKGFIESPAEYFTDSEVSALTKQRLLMLTNGWSSYFWNSVPTAGTALPYQTEAGIQLEGKAFHMRSGEPIKNGEITLVVEKDGEMAFLTQNVDKEGKFSFSGLLFNDTADVYIQARKKGSRKKTSIIMTGQEVLPVSREHISRLKGENEFPAELEKLKYHQATETEKNSYRKTQPANKQEEISLTKDGHFRLYTKADVVIEVAENESSYSNIIDFLAGKVAGLDISAGQAVMRGTTNIDGDATPLFLLDGVPLSGKRIRGLPEQIAENADEDTWESRNDALEKIRSIPMGDIEKVEILKSPQNLTIFGVEGANGVIAVYTRKGKSEVSENISKGVLEQKILGYSSYRRFYNPRYVPGEQHETMPDYRTTLYWEPQAILHDDATFSFFTSDQQGKYVVVVEGISETGRICMGTASFLVHPAGDRTGMKE